MIFAENVTKSYANGRTQTQVLKGVSLEVKKGELAVVLGASGSGKSTLLSVLSGLETPDSGRVVADGEEISAMSEGERTKFRRRAVGFVFQQYFLLPHLTAEKNVKLGADLAKNGSYREILAAVGLGEKRKKYPSELSGGEQQRVSIARAVAKNPKILFLDEPTGALDEETGRSVIDYLLKLQRERGFTAVMVTHNENLSETADRVIRMNSEKIIAVNQNGRKKSAYEIGW